MTKLKLNRRALDSLHALRMLPFLKHISTHPVELKQHGNCFIFCYSITEIIASLMMLGYHPLALVLRDRMVKRISAYYTGDSIHFIASIPDTVGNEFEINVSEIAADLNGQLCLILLEQIYRSVDAADRYVNAMKKLIYCSPELLVTYSNEGVAYTISTDTPKVDVDLIQALDKAMHIADAIVLSLRITSRQGMQRNAVLISPRVVSRSQPLRPIALEALRRHITTTAGTTAISTR